MGKRGLSNVIVTLIIIVISLIAVGLVWGVAQKIISEGAEDISLVGFTIDIEIPNAKIEGNNVIVSVKRNAGKGNLTGVNFVFSDEENTELEERAVSLKELESKVFNFTLDDLNVSETKSVSIYPVYLSNSGKETLGNIADTYNIISSGTGGSNGGNGGGGSGGGSGGSGGGGCTPVTDPCGTAVCGTVINGTCGTVVCGLCNQGFICAIGSCIPETSINSGIVDLTWPPEMNLFFDSFDLSKTQSYTGNFVNFPGSVETRCLAIIDHIFPSNPEDYNKSFVRLGTPNNEKSFVLSGDNYIVWASSSCGA